MKQKFFALILGFLGVVSCSKEINNHSKPTNETETEKLNVSALDQSTPFTSCQGLNLPVTYTFYGNGSKNMGTNTSLRAIYTGSFNTSKKISFQIAGNSSSVYARIVGKSSSTVYAMSSCTFVQPGGMTLTSTTNVPFGTLEIWLEFFSNIGTSVTWVKVPQ